MNILFDYSIFCHQKLGGISRYFINLQKEFEKKENFKTTTAEALIAFWRIAHSTIDYFNNKFEEPPKELSIDWKKTAFGIYQMPTCWIAYNALREKKIRKVIGIKKGLFDF